MRFFISETSSDTYSLGFSGYLSFQQSSTEFNSEALKTMKTLFHTHIVFLNFTGLHWPAVWFHHTVVQQAQLPSLEPLH